MRSGTPVLEGLNINAELVLDRRGKQNVGGTEPPVVRHRRAMTRQPMDKSYNVMKLSRTTYAKIEIVRTIKNTKQGT